jgi:hypothetical protein
LLIYWFFVVLTLRTPEEGGETNFPNTELGSISVPPIAGDAVLFYDFHPDGTHDARSEHAGLPVIKVEENECWVFSFSLVAFFLTFFFGDKLVLVLLFF